ncbi:alpha/beta-hydrolase [Pleomassaria siparia CBS 279.74]|uniref:Alpha/beta-hydrolase n=1 Tax=Pleomassaria siparia CBS 279.74 TaxID=1314801 RepID=A0A6G1JQ40_9PLEO|nr:alpha/beta-hydrolase [Pleomassaria siparia CBS 279.74]
MLISTLLPLMLTGIATAKICTNITIPVDISSRQGLFRTVPLEGNLDATAFIQEMNNIGQNYSAVLLQDYQTLVGSYEISAKFCYPDSGVKGSTVQLLTHGIGFDKTYWDLSFNNFNYSYTDAAVGKGYSTLAIDRLGIGNSSHGDPFNVVQAQAEVEALNAITTKLRNGGIPEISDKFDKVIHVGHSFGSVQSYWLSALYPDNTDGLVLTGWSTNASFLPAFLAASNLHIARLNQPLRFGNASSQTAISSLKSWSTGDSIICGVQSLLSAINIKLSTQDIWNEIATTEVGDLINGYNRTVIPLDYPTGYLTWSDFTANQYNFLLPGHFDLALGLVAESTKQPVTTGEILTIGGSPASSPFTGPVLIVTGQQDSIFCGGDCFATGTDAASIPAEAQKAFPNASAFEAYIQPESGHAINVHYNATGAYQVIQSWLGAHGLAA